MSMTVRWPSRDEIEKLNEILGFRATGDEQDWETEFADGALTQEFFECYKSEDLSPSQKMAVMQLVLASFDEMMYSEKDDPSLWVQISEALRADQSIHTYTIEYWCCLGETEADNMFPTTLRVREVADAL